MHRITFFPIGNADCTLVALDNGQKLLFDYADMRDPNDKNDRRINLAAVLKQDLGRRDYYDIVAFSHADNDHVCGASSFFYLQHAQAYQSSERIKIKELWVPAAMIVETGLEGDARILQAEARYRLKQGSGIRVFSRPAKLETWLQQQHLTLAARQHLITDAGQLVPGFKKEQHGIEFFVHSPFAIRVDADTVIDRNDCSLVFQVTFTDQGQDTHLILSADTTHEVLADMVRVTRFHGNDHRLAWDIFKLPHHCSYLSLSSEKGKDRTVPVPEVQWLFEEQGSSEGIIVSTSWPIPAEDTDQPPHRQAANYYKRRTATIGGQFKVTMEHPTTTQPEPLVITIDRFGAKVVKRNMPSGITIPSQTAPRAG